jgi:hypothetical protein
MTSKTWITDRSPGTEDLDSDGRIQIPVEPADPYSKGTAVSVSCWSEGLPWRKTHKGAAKAKQASIGRSCSTCCYWNKWAKPGGECRRNAPQSVILHAEMDDTEHIAYWPGTDDADWCGEWEAKS